MSSLSLTFPLKRQRKLSKFSKSIIVETLYFKVADAGFTIEAPSADDIKETLPTYAPFWISNPKKMDVEVILKAKISPSTPVNTEKEGEELGQFDCGGSNHGVYLLPDGGYKFVISTPEGDLAAAMRTSSHFERCDITPYGTESNKHFGVGNAMMIAFAFSAAYYNILLMHASVTINGGHGYLFLGKSGTGKSTHSSLWRKYIPGSDLLNDDNPALRVSEDGNVYVYGTPWSGKTPCYRNLRLPAGAIVRLEQAPLNEITREASLQAFASVLSSCSTMIWDNPSYHHITQTVESVARHTPVFYLKCRPDEEAARLSFNTITERSR